MRQSIGCFYGATLQEKFSIHGDGEQGRTFIYIEQGMHRHNLMVLPDPRIVARQGFAQRPLRKKLGAFCERLCAQCLVNGSIQLGALGRDAALEATDHAAVAVHEELLKVPGHIAAATLRGAYQLSV